MVVGAIAVVALLYGAFMVLLGRFAGFNKLPPG